MKLLFLFIYILFFFGCDNTASKEEDEPLYYEQWAINYDKDFYNKYAIDKNAHINATKSMNNYTGKGIKIAIIDIGVDINHYEYNSNIIKTINSHNASNNVKCINSFDCYHGDAVTGIIASNINNDGLRGIAPNVQIVFIKLNLGSDIGDDDILNALNYAEEQNVDIINNSWGTGSVSPIVKEKLDEMSISGRNGKGIIIVFASGNEGKENNKDESMLENVIGVGSSDEENLRAIYSNFGRGLDIIAPGGYYLGITTTNNSNTSRYMRAEDYFKFIGTSASAPLVSGAIALLLEKKPELTRVEVQNFLRDSADKIGSIDYINGRNDYYGNGKLNVDKLIDNIKY